LLIEYRILAKTDPALNDLQLVEALKTYAEHLAATENELLSKVNKLEKELQAYEKQGQAMTQILNRYSALLKKKADLNSEIKRLEEGSKTL
jgi:predicted nuclease of restriction endonuclease-like RecB superfamily